MQAAVLVGSLGQLRMKMAHGLEATAEAHRRKRPEMAHGLNAQQDLKLERPRHLQYQKQC